MGDTVGGAVGSAKATAGDAVGTVTEGATEAVGEVGLQLDRFMKASPLAVGAIAVGAGVLAGTILPETQREQEFLGGASRQVADTVRQTVDDVATKAEETLDETEQKVSTQKGLHLRRYTSNPVRAPRAGFFVRRWHTGCEWIRMAILAPLSRSSAGSRPVGPDGLRLGHDPPLRARAPEQATAARRRGGGRLLGRRADRHAVPDFGAWLIAFVPAPDFIDENWIRLAMLVLAVALPLAVGAGGLLLMDEADRPNGIGGKGSRCCAATRMRQCWPS